MGTVPYLKYLTLSQPQRTFTNRMGTSDDTCNSAEPQPYPGAPEDPHSKCQEPTWPRSLSRHGRFFCSLYEYLSSTSLFHCIVKRPLLLLSISSVLQTKGVLVLLTQHSNSARVTSFHSPECHSFCLAMATLISTLSPPSTNTAR